MKQRRLEREAERAAREAEAAAAARAREAAQFSSWARHEDAFHLHQARLRSQIRIRDGRGTHTWRIFKHWNTAIASQWPNVELA